MVITFVPVIFAIHALHQLLPGEEDGAVDRHGEPAVAATQHHSHQDDFAEREPRPTEGVVVVRDAGAEADGAERGYCLEDNAPDGEAGGGQADTVTLDDTYQEDGYEEP